MRNTTLYLYEFAPGDFELQDSVAGYYVAKTKQKPIQKIVLCDLLGELAGRGVEIRVVDNLWAMAERVMASSLDWSLCKMDFALPRPKENPDGKRI